MPTITFLGVGGAMAADPADNHTCLLVEAGATRLLLDCGPTIMPQLERVQVDAGWPTHVYVSHQHGDHILGLPMLLLQRVLFFRDRPLQVLAMPVVLKKARDLMAMAYPDLPREMRDQISFVPLEAAGESLPWPEAPGMSYRLAPCQHSVPTFAVRLDWRAGQSLVYSADTGPSADIARLATGASLLVHDSFYLSATKDDLPSHSAADQVGQLAAQAGVKTVALVHRKLTGAAAALDYRATAARHFSGETLAPAAGDTFQV